MRTVERTLVASIAIAMHLGILSAGCADRMRDTGARAPLRLEAIPVASALDVLEFRAGGGPAWLDDSTLVLLDRDEQQIVALDLTTGESRRGGRKGSGPGEMENGVAIGANATGIVVLDMRLNRAIEFDPALAFVRSQPVPGMPLSVVSADSGRVRALWMTFGPDGPDPRLGTIDMSSGDVGSVVRIFEASGLERSPSSSPFEPLFVSAARTQTGRVAVGIGNEYRIIELDAGGAVRASFGRPDLTQEPLSPERIAARRAAAARAEQRVGPPPRDLAAARDASFERPEPFFGPSAFATDGAGRLWVVTRRRGERTTEVDVFAAGAYRQTVELKDDVIALAFRGDRLAVLVSRTRDDIDGFNGIDLYRID